MVFGRPDDCKDESEALIDFDIGIYEAIAVMIALVFAKVLSNISAVSDNGVLSLGNPFSGLFLLMTFVFIMSRCLKQVENRN